MHESKYISNLNGPSRQRGATVVEYIVGLLAIVVVLLAPIPGQNNKNIVQLLEEAMKKEHSAYIYASSLPSKKD